MSAPDPARVPRSDDAYVFDAAEAVQRYRDDLERFLIRACGDFDMAADLIQDTYLRAVNATRPPKSPEDERRWLFTTALNLLRDVVRKTTRREALLIAATEEEQAMSSAVPGPDREMERRNVRHRVRRALDELRERDRLALLMRYEGFKHREIAEALGISTESVGTVLVRALDKVAAKLGLDGEGPQ